MSWNNKDQEIINELKSNNIDICSISETKKKGKGKYEIDDYTLIYSGVSRDKGTFGKEYISDRILLVILNVNKENIHLISVYAPDISKDRAERESFYEELQEAVDRIQAKDKIVIMGDLNARVGNEPLGGVTQRFNEEVMNDNGDLLKAFCAVNALRINNTFLDTT
ncbi:craniofacial development protein 2-like [Sitophilus oryzae]|uniref:Craniofacial development protein 2-like n=1 Tax=Sitophilus oryzae TaxID=7048 RepID=A0A6J2YJ10_SITOR|nr:craniofacial development protein 2-like [Sitophilus oryzae]